jgi:hypothetical protein
VDSFLQLDRNQARRPKMRMHACWHSTLMPERIRMDRLLLAIRTIFPRRKGHTIFTPSTNPVCDS